MNKKYRFDPPFFIKMLLLFTLIGIGAFNTKVTESAVLVKEDNAALEPQKVTIPFQQTNTFTAGTSSYFHNKD